MLPRKIVSVIIVHLTLHYSVNAFFDFPSFNWIKQQNVDKENKTYKINVIPNSQNGQKIKKVHFVPKEPKDDERQKIKQVNFKYNSERSKGQEVEKFQVEPKPEHSKGQEVEEFHFEPKHEDHKGQEVEEFHFGPEHEDQKGQKVEELQFGPKHEDHKGQEVEEIHFGSKPEHSKGQEIEKFHFGPKYEDHKGQEVEEFHFGLEHEDQKGQKVEELQFGPKHEDHNGQEVEEFQVGPKPEHSKGQEVEEFHFEPKHEDHKGQEVEEFHFGPEHEDQKGQKVEELQFGPKHEDHKGQEVEEIHFGSKPEHSKGQEIEKFHFGPKYEDHKGQEVEEFHFGLEHEDQKGQKVEELQFGPKHEDHNGQEVEEFQVGPKPEHSKGQEVEEFHFEPKHEDHKGQEVEEFHFGPEHEDQKGQKVEELQFGPKHEDHKGQEVEEIHFGSKPEHSKGQEIEKFHFGPKYEDHKGQEVEKFHFGPEHEDQKGQKVEELQFGPKHEDQKGQEVEEIHFGSKPEHSKGQEIEKFHFGPKYEDHKGQEVEEFHFGPKHEGYKGQEVEEINKGYAEKPTKSQVLKTPTDESSWLDSLTQEVDLTDCSIKPGIPDHSVLIFKSDRRREVLCEPGYRFSNNYEKIELECDGSRWISSADIMPECNPICEPPCQNNGICIATNQCSCPKNFEGAQCQFGHKPCLNQPPVSLNSYVNCNSSKCLVKCFDNYSFPDGSSITHLVCHYGQWSLSRPDWSSLPDCKPSCEPPCINGGSCLDFNKCQCPRQYVGSQCQYELSACDAKKLNFNGYYTCRGENEKVSCTLSCPEGHETDTPLAKEYICHYSDGKFSPVPIPKCRYDKNTEVIQFASSSHAIHGGSESFETNQVPYHTIPASTAECLTWKNFHYKNFDGKLFSFEGHCSYILAENTADNTFRIIIENAKCETCTRSLKVYYQDQEYKLYYNGKSPVLIINDKEVPVPNQFMEFSVEKIGDHILVSLRSIDVTLNWNAEDRLSVTINKNMWNKTGGLCGNFNNNPNDDFLTPDASTAWNLEIFVQSWVENPYECESVAEIYNNCTDDLAKEYCKKIFTDVHFEECYNAGILIAYQEVCVWDVCRCGKSCTCETIHESVRACKNYLLSKGISDSSTDWRQISDCPLLCPPGKIYSSCGPLLKNTCGSFGMDDNLMKYSECIEGCYCSEGLFHFNDTCIRREYCPCKWRNKYYNKGETLMKDCNTCTCQNGEWECTTLKCPARCSITGNSHYLTFDGKRYDFDGQCNYYLLKSENYSIEAENQLCKGDFLNEIFHSHFPKHVFCSKSVTIRHNNDEVKLKQNKEILVNGEETLSLPVEVNGVTARLVSRFVIVKLMDNTEIWWDGNTNIYIDLPGNALQPTGGLCGTFNDNQKDDFTTPEGDIEQTVISFAEKWIVDETCSENADYQRVHPCDLNVIYKEIAEKYCQKIKGKAFKDCHTYVDVEPFYKNCLYDLCSCQKELKHCFCPIFADYANECARHNVILPWRNELRECGLHCLQGQIYQPCVDSCAGSCQDISIAKGNCDKKCVEGCGCPDGLVLNSFGKCIPVSNCPCFHQNLKYKSNHELIMESDNGPQFCICQDASWSCRAATKLEIARDYENSEYKCNETLHEEYTTCKPPEYKTCKNMHEKPKHSNTICFPGCVCKKGFVWDSIGKLCVNASECPCHHGGRSYADGEKIQQDCNSCTCKNGMWLCTDRECSSICSTWGDSHFKTFDGKMYEFQGSCDFVLASGVISEYETFLISVQIVPCGSTGISCPKSVSLTVGSPQKEEKVVFKTSELSFVSQSLTRILIREVGLFIYAEVFDLGITVKWDKGTRVYVKADSRWKNKVKGLCGNFNNNELDDFKTPSSGETNEISSVLFADSWRMQSYCPESNQITDTCARRPHRKAWASQKCSILNSETFEPCHSEVPFQPYLERCVTDSCGCDQGGDCECMCTAIAAYAEECTLRGVPIKWRTQQLCPLQCEDNSKYNPCISSCPPKSCENQFTHSALLQTCSEESCVEGCDRLHCPPEQVLADSFSNRCIPIASCKTVCLTVNNVTYLEGDLMESDDCHSCYCSRHKKVCIGEPCSEVTSTMASPIPTSACSENQIWDNCIVKCDHVCNNLMYKLRNELQCFNSDDCVSGCREIDLKCLPGLFLRDEHTCVHKKDCPCGSTSGLLLKPGDVIEESACEKCQCVNNEYECINMCLGSSTMVTIQPSYNYTRKRYTDTPGWDFFQEGNVTLTPHRTVTPPVSCPHKLYESLIDKFTRFSASSHLDESSLPAFGQMFSKGIWMAGANDADQYIQVDLGRVETVFAVNVAGSSNSYVTGYNLLYSINGDKFLYILNHDRKKEIFGGPFDGYQSVKQMLPTAIEARYIRFHPTSWHGQISMKVDVLGCKDLRTLTTLPSTTPVPLVCNKLLRVGQKYYPNLEISATSSKPGNGPEFIGLDNEKGWRPLSNSKSEFVQLDFGDRVNFTGIITKGVSHTIESSSFKEESWVERYKVEYSHDGFTWNPILDEFGDETIFMGNTDSETEKKNFFNFPIHAKALKIKPVKWHENIALRLDVMGCYEFSSQDVEAVSSTLLPAVCNVCPGVLIDKENCNCNTEEWWNGEICVSHSECPCFVGLIAYPVGTTFSTEKCEECVCRLFGLSHCTAKICQDCPKGLQKVLTPLCGCTCKPCEENTRLCPTSNICLRESAWCDGVQDCPDDELNCISSSEVSSTFIPCVTSCPPGYDVVFRNKTAGPAEGEDVLSMERVKSIRSKNFVKTYRKSKKVPKFEKLTECLPYDCVPMKEIAQTVCPPPECPVDYAIIYEKHFVVSEAICPKYTCEPISEYSNCTILSKHIKTFDGIEFKPEICDHVLVTHNSGLWNVTMVKNCNHMLPCTTTLLVNHNGHKVELYSHNRLVKVDSFSYSDDQIELLNSKLADFTLNSIGNSFIFKSNIYDFEIVYGLNGNFKIKVPSHMKGYLAGLCGLYNGHPNDDKTRPDGNISRTSVDFTDSWLNPGAKECVEIVCPIEKQHIALEICLKLKEKPFNSCSENVNLELCVESACDCLNRNETKEYCRCQVLSDFVTECRSSDLFGWRIENDCPTSCAPNLVYYDCYPYACQPTCGNEECNEPAVNCYSGCFCPDGLVKRGNQCVKPQECRDCVCRGVGNSTYLTFDGGLTFNGNCTYVATREKNPTGVPSFEVLIGNTLCNGSDFMTCTNSIEVKVPGNSIKMVALPDTEETVKVLVNGQIEKLQKGVILDKIWSKIDVNPDSFSIHVQLPWEHVDVRYFYKKLAFTISLPSHYYREKVEGLCGTCSQKMVEPEEIESPDMWQVEKNQNCIIEPPASCTPTPHHRKICLFMNDTKIFEQCLALVDPTPFIDQCLTLACVNGHVCSSLEAYDQACRDAGVCENWRSEEFCPFTCPSDLEYQACNRGCQKTCNNYDEVHPTCENLFIEGCFCPNNQVLINGTCKAEKFCEYCDVEGHHYEDELWQVDKCTNCTCKNHVVTCERTECPRVDIICEEDHVVLKEENDLECCPKYKCECKSQDKCTKIEMPNDLLPGMEAIVNETGCCPRVEVVCRLETCPRPKPCNQHYVQKIINTTNCCPEYFCEKPDNKCIYEFGETFSEGKKRVERDLKRDVIKKIGERWTDGPCKSCICIEKDGYAEAVCTISKCLSLKDHHDFNDYELEEVHNLEKCCPEVIRKACKHNERLYKVGDVWIPDENNPCETLKCNNWGGQIVKETRLEVCNRNCEPGWEYKHSEGACCGQCVQSGCFAEDKIFKEGEYWFSKDKCSKSTCVLNQGRFTIISEMKTCPPIDDCPKEDIYEDECCLKCKTRSKSKVICSPQLLAPELTIDLIRLKKGRHGECHNLLPVKNFTQCAGNCNSFTMFQSETWSHASVCECCKPEKFAQITVNLVCRDGLQVEETVMVPSECACKPCS